MFLSTGEGTGLTKKKNSSQRERRGWHVHQEGISSTQYISIDRKSDCDVSTLWSSAKRLGVVILCSCDGPNTIGTSSNSRSTVHWDLPTKDGVREECVHSNYILSSMRNRVVVPRLSCLRSLNETGQPACLVTLYLRPQTSERKTKYIFEFS